MKKVIAAAAGLMLVGAMVSTASAAVTFGGDARARMYSEHNYDLGATDATGERVNKKDQKINSRIRVKVNADAKGGAYARARIKIADGNFDGATGKKAVVTDYGYIGVPIGPVTIEGGRINTSVTKFFKWDDRDDMLAAKWSNDMTAVQAWYIKSAELTDAATDFVDDNDKNGYAAILTQKFGGDWSMTVGGFYFDDETPADESGFTGTIGFAGPGGPVNLAGELSYANGDLTGSEDDGYGGYLQAGMNFGATSVTLNGGFTKDGFAADNDFGFIMIAGASSITPGAFDSGGKGLGLIGDTTWIGGIVSFKASEALSLKGILAYADISDWGDAFEISGSMVYVISDGANFQWDIGYLGVSVDDNDDEENPFGTAATLNISF